ncbi:immunoglobulin superfamily member 10-like [Dendronephthya gigantea]|uniref:immunoglobulin superfamily member 10-like n=1 Tax=Dendronephthya gigantea TaxID=151771 RepID=UPI0010698812|nr:immunoglobulin superfamily member 10-like [Dendronephthya gigantea]
MSEQIPERYKHRVRIVNQATLQIVNVTIEDEGDYLCEISDYPAKWKTLSRVVKLHVLVPPKIVSHPPDTRLLREGEEIRLGCNATGRPIPEVSWYNGSIELTKGVKKDKGSAEYINPKVSRWDNGNYKCVAKNIASQVEYTVEVIVRYTPFRTKIKIDAKSDTLERGEDLKIVCEACSKPPPIFNLYHYSEVGVMTEIVKVQNNTKGEFYIRNIKPSQRGKYSCVPHNDVGVGTEAIVRVRVRFSPVIKRIAARRTNLTKGENLVIWCDTEGYPIPRIKWTNKYGRIISNDRTFRKNNVNENDDGLYTCTTNNGISPSANKSVYINVFYRPVIDLQKSSGSKHALKGDTVFLRCNATGNPTPTYEWRKGSSVIASKPSTSLDGLKNADFGKYTCFARNFVGVTTHEVKVFRIDKPSITELNATELNSRFVHIQWKIHGDTQFPIKKQELVCISKKNNAVMVNKTMTGHRRSEKIKDLKPFTTYEVRLKVWNKYVPSDPKKLKFQTKTATPGPPGQPRIQFLDTTSVRVTWDPPKETNGELLQYRLFYRIANDSSTEKLNNVNGSETSLKVVLKRNVEYIFKVKAVTSSGPGQFSREKYFLMVYQGIETTKTSSHLCKVCLFYSLWLQALTKYYKIL